jgi:ubiquinone/menaquinone biosynthesis C-methylase UbiE
MKPISMFLAIVLISPSLIAKESVPPALTEYMGREIAVTMHYTGAPWLVRESRQREEDCEQLLAALNIKPGQVVCDMGCGNGFYALKLAKLVGPAGQVLAVDIQSEMLGMLRAEMRRAKLDNIKPLLGTPIDPRLEPNSVDLVLMVDVYHEFSHPEQMLQAIRESLKPHGRIALAEFREEDPLVPIKLLHKMSKAQIMKEFLANRFKLVEEYDKLPWQHLMFFERGEGNQGSDE